MAGDTPVWGRRDKEKEGKTLPSFLQCEPLGSHKEGTFLPASLPEEWACWKPGEAGKVYHTAADV